MLILISPAKTLDFATPAPTHEFSQADFLKQSRQLIKTLRTFSPQKISTLMHVSDKLALLNAERFSRWETPFSLNNSKQALFAFQGDVYTGMQAEKFSQDDIAFAQQHLRILSGLYGLLRPLDLIQAYRLEMGTGLVNVNGKNLYAFWGDSISNAINKQLAVVQTGCVVNLASDEYFSAVKPALLHAKVISPIFKDKKSGEYKVISFFAKKARGMMTDYIIRNRMTHPEGMKSFNGGGYTFSQSMSSEFKLIFVRDE